jgi:hypothetical protein
MSRAGPEALAEADGSPDDGRNPNAYTALWSTSATRTEGLR